MSVTLVAVGPQSSWAVQAAADSNLSVLVCLRLSQMKVYVRAQKFHWLSWLKPLRLRAGRSVRRIVTIAPQATWGRLGPPIASNALKRAIRRANGRPFTSSVYVRFIDLFSWRNCTDANLSENIWSTLGQSSMTHLGLVLMAVVVNWPGFEHVISHLVEKFCWQIAVKIFSGFVFLIAFSHFRGPKNKDKSTNN